jgi:hypothetical protein
MADEKPAEPGKKPAKKAVDWDAIERDYRAGIKTQRQMADEHGVSHVAINKHAAKAGWSRDLAAKIKAKAAEKVTKAQVTSEVTKDRLVTEKLVVEANAEIVAQADLANRKDVQEGNNLMRGLLAELDALSDPQFRDKLVELGKDHDQTYVTETGREIKDRENELYQYIIGFSGRVKALKELSAVAAVMVPLQRKILKLDNEADESQAEVDALLARINASVN